MWAALWFSTCTLSCDSAIDVLPAGNIVSFRNAASGQCIGADGFLWPFCHPGPEQDWMLRDADGSNVVVNFVHARTRGCLGSDARGGESQPAIKHHLCDGGMSQRWIVLRSAAGAFRLQNLGNRLCASVDQTALRLRPCDAAPDQRWMLH